MHVNELTDAIIGCAIEVHKVLVPGLLEAPYEACLCRELSAKKTGLTLSELSRPECAG